MNLRGVKIIVIVALALFVFITRFYDLGSRPCHHDESVHNSLSYDLAAGKGYRYNPTYHGPFLYYVSATMFTLFGASDGVSRIMPAIFGVVILGVAIAFARLTGRRVALMATGFLAISPTVTYYSRFIREDLYIATFTIGSVLCFVRYVKEERPWQGYLTAACAALAFVTKESAYVTSFIFLWYGILLFYRHAIVEKSGFSVTWHLVFKFISRNRWVFLCGLLIFCSIWILFYTAFFSYPRDWNAFGKAIGYWWGQHKMQRVGGPKWFYLPLLLIYEFPIFVLGLAGAVWSLMRGDRLSHFFAYWSLASLLMYSYLGEKVPWLQIHIIQPMVFSAAYFLSHVVQMQGRRLVRSGILVATVAASLFMTYLMIRSNFVYNAPRSEPVGKQHFELIQYVQTTYDIRRVEEAMKALGIRPGKNEAPAVSITSKADWPLAWYLRGYNVNFSQRIRLNHKVIVCGVGPEARELRRYLADTHNEVRIELRAWWTPGLRDVTLSGLVRYVLFAETFTPVGSFDLVLWTVKDPSATLPDQVVELKDREEEKSEEKKQETRAPAKRRRR